MKKFVLFSLLLAVTNIFAQKVAIVLSTTNKVIATYNKATRSLSRGSALEAGDAISTYEKAQTNIKYLNGTLVNIGANSNYKILAFAPKQSDVQIKAELTKGSIYSKTTGKSKESLKTPVTALAILGTKYAVDVKSKREVYVNVYEGHVKIRGIVYGPGSSILVTPNRVSKAKFPDEKKLNYEYNNLDMEENTVVLDDRTEVGESGTSIDTGSEEIVGLVDTSIVIPEIINEEMQCEHGNEIAFH